MNSNVFGFGDQQSAAKSLKKISQLMQRAGQPVVSTSFDMKPRRTSNVTFREALLTLASGQTITLRVTQSGDVYSVLLNGQVKPIKNAGDQIRAIGEIAKLAETNQAAFQKKQARVKVDLPSGIKTAAPRMEVALQARATELETQIAERQGQVAALKEELGEVTLDDATLDGARKHNQKDYAFYVVVGNKIESGWEYDDDAKEHKADNMPEKLKPTAKVLKKAALKSKGIDPDDNAQWLSGAALDSTDQSTAAVASAEVVAYLLSADGGAILDKADRPKFDPKTDRWVTTESGSHLMIRGGVVVAGAGGKFNGWKAGEPAPSAGVAAQATKEKNYNIAPARYAKSKLLVRPTSDGSGFKTSGHDLADAIVNGHQGWSNREKGYVMSKAQADLFEGLVKAGARRASIFERDVEIDGRRMNLSQAKAHLKKNGVTLDSAADDEAFDQELKEPMDAASELIAGLLDGSVLDSASTADALATLRIALGVVENNYPINLASGNLYQADLERRCAESYRHAIGLLDSTDGKPDTEGATDIDYPDEVEPSGAAEEAMAADDKLQFPDEPVTDGAADDGQQEQQEEAAQ